MPTARAASIPMRSVAGTCSIFQRASRQGCCQARAPASEAFQNRAVKIGAGIASSEVEGEACRLVVGGRRSD
jgi:hypothetical protein